MTFSRLCPKSIAIAALLTFLGTFVPHASATPPPGYYLVWSDEFNGNTLDLSKWFYFTGVAQDTQDVPDAITVTNGFLTITTYATNNVNYTGIISTDGRIRGFRGYYESSIQWGDTNSMWSAFWLTSPNVGQYLRDPYVSGTELDICEHRYVDVSNTNVISGWVQETLHWDGYGVYEETYQVDNIGSNLNNGFHTYGFLWTTTNYQWFIDDGATSTTTQGLSGRSEPMLLSCQSQTPSWSGSQPAGGFPNQTNSQLKLVSDYVRYYAPPSMLFWTGASSANWNDSGNWISNMTVTATNDAVFNWLSGNNFNITFSTNTTANNLYIQEVPPMTFSGSPLTLTGGFDLVSALNDASVSCPVILGADQTWRTTGGRTLTVSSPISGTGNLTVSGYGAVQITGTNSASGTLSIAGGSLVNYGVITSPVNVTGGTMTGVGTYSGPVQVSAGTILVGFGTPTSISNSLTFNAGGSATFYTDPSNGTNSVINVQQPVVFGGTLALANLSGPYAVGQTFKLFNAPSYSGQFTSFSPAVPGYEMGWDTSTMTNDGTLRVKFIPAVITTNIFESRAGSSTAGVNNTTNFSFNGFSSTISATKSTAAGCSTPGSSRFSSTASTSTSFTVTPTLLVGTSYSVDVTWGNGGSFPETPTLVVAPTVTGASSNNFPATTTAFSGLTGNTNNNRWKNIGTFTPTTTTPSVTFTYVSGLSSGRWYADAVRFTSLPGASPGSLTNQMMGTNLVLNWAGQFTLQYSTNPAGPFIDVPGQVLAGPFTNKMTNSQIFYRLRE